MTTNFCQLLRYVGIVLKILSENSRHAYIGTNTVESNNISLLNVTGLCRPKIDSYILSQPAPAGLHPNFSIEFQMVHLQFQSSNKWSGKGKVGEFGTGESVAALTEQSQILII